MPRLTKIYTRQGDQGETSLGGGQRVSKDDLRVRAYGSVDELNSIIGVVLAQGVYSDNVPILTRIQNELFNLGVELAFLESDKKRLTLPRIEGRHVAQLEQIIDTQNAVVGALDNFILPGGSLSAAYLQLARAICRRAECEVTALSRHEEVGEYVLPYLNRLSDALFVIARFENHHSGLSEELWDSHI
jgi:cob(I)alamin adenosyltransferase